MHFLSAHKWLSGVIVFFLLLVGFVLWQFLYIKFNGTAVVAPKIPRVTERFGSSGSAVNYVVMGDSTSISQGADYAQGIARHTARLLGETHQVALTNVGIAGARMADVARVQVSKAVQQHPDVVLLAIGANDVTHVTAQDSIQKNLQAIVATLQTANPKVQILLTGSPAMGSVPRFAAPTQWLARQQEHKVNHTIAAVAARQHLVLVPLARATEKTFLEHPEYFAQDNFHPNAEGYAVWFPTLDAGLAQLDL